MNARLTVPLYFVTTAIVTTLSGVAARGETAPAPPKWERSAAVGLTVTSGNSETLLFTANLLASYKGDKNEISLGADATYGESEDATGDDVKNADSLRGFAQYNRLFTERVYGYARLEVLHDDIADLNYRITLSPGVGYYFIKTDRTRLSAEGGPSFIYEDQGPGSAEGYLALRLAEKFEHKVNDSVRIWQSVEFLPQVDDFENFIINAEIGVESALSKKLSMRTYLQNTYDNQPAPGRKKNDLKLVAALAYKF